MRRSSQPKSDMSDTPFGSEGESLMDYRWEGVQLTAGHASVSIEILSIIGRQRRPLEGLPHISLRSKTSAVTVRQRKLLEFIPASRVDCHRNGSAAT